jgi:ubiquinone/menaquinone biosynthesis C-methylase UbiE
MEIQKNVIKGVKLRNDINWEEVNHIVARELYSGLTKILVDVSHKNLAKFGNKLTPESSKVLEIGSGRGEHFRFVKGKFSEYVMSDISDWGRTHIESIMKEDSRVRFELQNIEKLDFPDNSFDRVICTCVLMHVDQPFEALMEMHRVTRPGGG